MVASPKGSTYLFDAEKVPYLGKQLCLSNRYSLIKMSNPALMVSSHEITD